MKLIEDSFAAYVNMDHRKDRRDRMQEVLPKAGIHHAVRWRGMRPEEYTGDKARVQVMQNRTPGAIGCHFSQVGVMEAARDKGKHAFVMEDDLQFCQDFPKRVALMEEFLAVNDWDVLWLGGTFHVGPPWWHKTKPLCRDAECTNNPRMMRTYGAFCTYAYIVNRDRVDRVLRMLDEQLDKSMGIDWAFIQIQPELNTFAFVPGSIIQIDNMSDIGKGMTVFSGFKKLGPYWFQERLEDFDPTSFDWKEANRKS